MASISMKPSAAAKRRLRRRGGVVPAAAAGVSAVDPTLTDGLGDWHEVKARKGVAKLQAAISDEDWRKTKLGFRRTAMEYAQSMAISTPVAAGAECYMSYLRNGSLVWMVATSGRKSDDEKKINEHRSDASVEASKVTVCAEEHLLAEHPNVRFMHSFTINVHGLVAACAGCIKLLRLRGIDDIPRRIRGKSENQ